jgi:putative ABC transport system permease protein
MGTNTIMIRAGSRRSWGIRSGAGTMNTLTVDGFDAILRECPTVRAVSPSAAAGLFSPALLAFVSRERSVP